MKTDNEISEAAADNHIPLKKLINRYRTDLKLANYPDGQDSLNHETKRKNLTKASVLYYLELLDNLLPHDRKHLRPDLRD